MTDHEQGEPTGDDLGVIGNARSHHPNQGA